MKKYSTQTEIPIELIQLWEAAWAAQPTKESPFIIECSDSDQRTNFKQHLYQVRKKLSTENYPGASNFMKLQLFHVEGNLGFKLPAWFKAVQARLKEAGVEPQPITTPVLQEPVQAESANLTAIQHLFKNPIQGEQK